MTYKSQLTRIIQLEEEKQQKIKEEIHQLHQWHVHLTQLLQKEEERMASFWDALQQGMPVSSSFFSGGDNRAYCLQKQKELDEIRELLRQKNMVFQESKRKLERLVDMDKERERAYLHAIEKKEEREVEELKTMMKHVTKGGDTGADF